MDYQKQALEFLQVTGTKFKATFLKHDKHFADDKVSRDIYQITLSNSRGKMTVKFGQSIANQGQAPTPYDVLTCLTKYDPEDFEWFCSNYGYDTDSRSAEKIYKAVCKEWQQVDRLFSSEELELLQEIN
jgi:ATP:corrinoid adenosyltransferase